MKGDPMKLKELCPDWNKCLDSVMGEFDFSCVEEAEAYLAYNCCCGCAVCVLLRHKVGCGDECEIRQKYPQYRDDDALFGLAVSWDPAEIAEELEEQGIPATMEEVFEEGVKRQMERSKQLKKLMEASEK